MQFVVIALLLVCVAMMVTLQRARPGHTEGGAQRRGAGAGLFASRGMARRDRGKRSVTTFWTGRQLRPACHATQTKGEVRRPRRKLGELPTARNADASFAQARQIFRYTPRPIATRHRPVFSSSVGSLGASSRECSDRQEKMKCQGEDTRICSRRLQSRPRCELRRCPVWDCETEQTTHATRKIG